MMEARAAMEMSLGMACPVVKAIRLVRGIVYGYHDFRTSMSGPRSLFPWYNFENYED